MLEEVGEEKAAARIVSAIEAILAEGKVRTRDLGGTTTTSGMGDAIVKKLQE